MKRICMVIIIVLGLFTVLSAQETKVIEFDLTSSNANKLDSAKTNFTTKLTEKYCETDGVELTIKVLDSMVPSSMKIKFGKENIFNFSRIKNLFFVDKQSQPGKTLYYVIITKVGIIGKDEKIIPLSQQLSFPLAISIDGKIGTQPVKIENHTIKLLPCERILKTLKHPFTDAKDLADAIENKSENVLTILRKYTDEKLKDIDDALKPTAFSTNPYIKDHLEQLKGQLEKVENENGKMIYKLRDAITAKRPEPESESSKLTGSALSPAKFADALGSFLAERFKEELSLNFLNKFKKKLKEEGLDILFKATAEFLNSTKIYNFKLFMPTLKAAFLTDLNNFETQFFAYLKFKKDKDGINKNVAAEISRLNKAIKKAQTDEKDLLKAKLEEEKRTALSKRDAHALNMILLLGEVLSEARQKKHPFQILRNLDNSPYLKTVGELSPRFYSGLKLALLISNNLTNINSNAWIKPKDFGGLNTAMKRELFIGLIMAKEKENMTQIKFKSVNLYDILKNNKARIDNVNTKLQKILKLGESFEKKIEELEELKSEDKPIFKIYQQYLTSIVEFIGMGSDLAKLIGDPSVAEKIDDFVDNAKLILEIAGNFHDKHYGQALLKIIKILKEILPDSPLRSEIDKYLTFAVNMIMAEDAKSMQKVLEAAALPVGSYRHKRRSSVNISVNAYVGGYYTNRLREDIDSNPNLQYSSKHQVGLTAPVGLSLSFGKLWSKGTDYGHSLSFFLPILDVGAVVDWRLKGEEGDLPELKWKNILSPGALVMWGFKKSIISIGAGWQLGPQLREFTKEEGNVTAIISKSRFRFRFIIAFDIPIFNFYTK